MNESLENIALPEQEFTPHDNRPGDTKNGHREIARESSDNRDDNRLIEWRPVHRHPSYEVSNTGQVRRDGKILKQLVDKCGYMRIGLGRRGKGLQVHSLVAEAFICPRPGNMTIDHIDDDKSNNHATNLEYVTRAENIAKAHRTGRYPKGEDKPESKLTADQVREIKRLLPTRNNCQLGREYGVSDVAIRKIRLGLAWRHVA